MREQLQKRLEELREELSVGQNMLSNLQTQQRNLEHTLLRISGAVQILEELLNGEGEKDKLEVGIKDEPSHSR